MSLQFNSGAELAQFFGFGDLYKAAEENEANGNEVAESIKKMMEKVDEASRNRNKKDYFD